MYRNTSTSWGTVARALHWSIALLIVVQVGTGIYYEEFSPKEQVASVLSIHAQMGVMIFVLVLIRMIWRLANPVPSPSPLLSAFSKAAAKTVHASLYLCLLVLPLSGWIYHMHLKAPLTILGWFTIPKLITRGEDETLLSAAGYTHYYAAWLVMALVSVHIGAALWHHLVLRDDVLKKMLGRQR